MKTKNIKIQKYHLIRKAWSLPLLVSFLLITIVWSCSNESTEDQSFEAKTFSDAQKKAAFGLTELSVELPQKELYVGQMVQFEVRGKYRDGNTENVSPFVEVMPDQKAEVFALTDEGRQENQSQMVSLQLLQDGKSKIHLVLGSVQYEFEITIYKAKLYKLYTDPQNIEVFTHKKTLFKIIGVYTDGSIQELQATPQVELAENQPSTGENTNSEANTSEGQGEQTENQNSVASNNSVKFEFEAKELEVAFDNTSKSWYLITSSMQASFVKIKYGEISLTPQVILLDGSPKQLEIDPASFYLVAQNPTQFRTYAITADDKKYEITELAEYSIDDENIANVIKNEKNQMTVTGLTTGKTQLNVNYLGQTASTSISVNFIDLKEIGFKTTDSTIYKGVDYPLQVYGISNSGSKIENIAGLCTLASSNNEIITIDDTFTGIFKALNIGEVEVSAQCLNATNSIKISVEPALIQDIVFKSEEGKTIHSLTIPKGAIKNVLVMGMNNDTEESILEQVTIEPADEAIITTFAVNGDKTLLTFQGAAVGEQKINFTYMGIKASLPVTIVDAEMTAIRISPVTKTIPLGKKQGFNLFGLFTDNESELGLNEEEADWVTQYNTLLYAKPVGYVSNNEGSRGVLTSLNEGIIEVVGKFMGKEAKATITITPPIIEEVKLTTTIDSLELGETSTVTATATLSNDVTVNLSELCERYTIEFNLNTKIPGNVEAISIDDLLCTNGTVTITALDAGVAKIRVIATSKTDENEDPIESDLLTFGVSMPCMENAMTKSYGNLDKYDSLYCWHLGDYGENCNDVCTNAGKTYHSSTETYASNNSYTNRCKEVAQKFDIELAQIDFSNQYFYYQTNNIGQGLGCSVYSFFGTPLLYLYSSPTFNEAHSDLDHRRICSCGP